MLRRSSFFKRQCDGLNGSVFTCEDREITAASRRGRPSVEVILTDWPSVCLLRETADGGGDVQQAEIILPILWRIRMGSLFIARKTMPLIQRLL